MNRLVGILFLGAAVFATGCTEQKKAKKNNLPPGMKALTINKLVLEESFFTVANYDPERDAAKDLQRTTERAVRSGGKRILIEVGGKW